MKQEETSQLLNTLTCISITQYNLTMLNRTVDMSQVTVEIIAELKARGVTLVQIENEIAENDFTGLLTDAGSGRRERGFVMEVIKDYYGRA